MKLNVFIIAFIGYFQISDASPQNRELSKALTKTYRNATVFLEVKKIAPTGAVHTSYGSGFLVTSSGHFLTSCHVVDKNIRLSNGETIIADSVEIRAAIASRYANAEPATKLRCGLEDVDVALLKLNNSSVTRTAVPVAAFEAPDIGDSVGIMGFPLDTEFYAREGTIGGATPNDLMTLDVTLNQGDSGGPVFNKAGKVIALAEGGYVGGGIGLARPIRHAVMLLSEAGVNVYAVNANIADIATPVKENIAVASLSAVIDRISKSATGHAPKDALVTVSYPVSRTFTPYEINKNGSIGIKIANIEAAPGYKVTDAKFVVTGYRDAQVVEVKPLGSGKSTIAVFKAISPDKINTAKPAYVQGYIETTQRKIE